MPFHQEDLIVRILVDTWDYLAALYVTKDVAGKKVAPYLV